MTDTLISLISIFIGIVGANITASIFKKYSFGIIGNTIAGVFGSILLIKLFGRLGFTPQLIMQSGIFHLSLFIINSIVSFLGGSLAVILITKLKNKMNKS
ncbi:hypothetical protein D9V96_011860 [Zobellia laminariae]|uniref:GlsB/YeaQ/YmgE family stress response membrane protein n=1 Tax=Zobellia barbeyronii TaxID=2748009 RepID=A0ABS5WEX9_9FLAO|nr:hypothetical protein [Zobellia barbeyronii]MBT2161949.1 hypothetical protein [Zobellia barbeyronii]MUH41903.1 hypothetical protein [Zobellia laminariae]